MNPTPPVHRWRDGNADGDLVDEGDDILYFTNDANMNVTAAVDASSAVQVALRPHGHADGSVALPPR